MADSNAADIQLPCLTYSLGKAAVAAAGAAVPCASRCGPLAAVAPAAAGTAASLHCTAQLHNAEAQVQ